MRPNEDNYKVRYERLLGQRDNLRAENARLRAVVEACRDEDACACSFRDGVCISQCDYHSDKERGLSAELEAAKEELHTAVFMRGIAEAGMDAAKDAVVESDALRAQLAAANEALAKAERYGKMRDKTISEILVEHRSAHAMLNDELNYANWRADTWMGKFADTAQELEAAYEYIGSEQYASDYRTASEMRAALNAANERAADFSQELEAAYSSLRDATDERDRLAAMVDKAEHERDALRLRQVVMRKAGDIADAYAYITAENERLRTALAPFAKEGNEWDCCTDTDDMPIMIGHPNDVVCRQCGDSDVEVNQAQFTLGDLRRAADALAPKETPDE